MSKTDLPSFIRNENEDKLEIRYHSAIEKFKSEINLQKKSSEKYPERFMKTEVETITYLLGHFENTEFCDAHINKWETEVECILRE